MARVFIFHKKYLIMVWLIILLLILIIAPEVIILMGVMIIMVIVGIFEMLFHVLGIDHDKDDKKRNKKE